MTEPLYPPIEPFAHAMLDVGDGHRLYWEQCGNPDGRPAVVLHGGPGTGCSPRLRRWFDPARSGRREQPSGHRVEPHAGVA